MFHAFFQPKMEESLIPATQNYVTLSLLDEYH